MIATSTRSRQLGTSTALTLLVASALLSSYPANAKPGGCRTMSKECRTTIQFEGDFRNRFGSRPVQLYLAGTGFASFTNVPLYGPFDTREALTSNIVAMEWETTHCYAGNFPELGIISATARV